MVNEWLLIQNTLCSEDTKSILIILKFMKNLSQKILIYAFYREYHNDIKSNRWAHVFTFTLIYYIKSIKINFSQEMKV